jgi:predicted MarR family transcription regulator
MSFGGSGLRSLVASLLGADYTANQMTYNLRRLRLHGLIERIPRTNTYVTTPEGLGAALFYTKVHDRILSPLLSPDRPPAPQELRRAMATIDHVIADYVAGARLKRAA